MESTPPVRICEEREKRRPPKMDVAVSGPLASVVRTAVEVEASGFHRIWVPEITHNPFMSLAAATGATSRIELATGVAVAFARTPMSLAYEAWGLQELSGGRAVIGIGSQVKPHIEHRFAMPWSAPVDRMREFILAVRTILSCWRDGRDLEFRGDFYSHTLMPPMFRPNRNEFDLPPLLLAGVGPRMTRLAGEVADGLLLHPFSSADYLRSAVLPGVAKARAAAEASAGSRLARPFELVAGVLVATGANGSELAAAQRDLRRRIAFYASTPSYRELFVHHGWEAVHARLHGLSREGRWDRMAELIDDDICRTIGAVGTPEEVADIVAARFDGVVDRVTLYDPNDNPGPALLDVVRATGRGGTAASTARTEP